MGSKSLAAARNLVGLALASALCAPAAAIAASVDFYIKLPPIEGDSGKGRSHGGEIEIHSFSWGASKTPAGIREVSGLKSEVDVIESTGTAGKDMTLKGSKIGENSTAPAGEWVADIERPAAKRLPGKRTPPTVTLKRGTSAAAADGVQVAAGDIDGDGRAALARPLAAGSVTVRGKFPSCTVGARYPSLELGAGATRYTLQDVVITSCGGDAAAGDALPMEEVSFNYAKIKT